MSHVHLRSMIGLLRLFIDLYDHLNLQRVSLLIIYKSFHKHLESL